MQSDGVSDTCSGPGPSGDSGSPQPPGANIHAFCSPGGWARRQPHCTLGRHGAQGPQDDPQGTLLLPLQDTLKGHLLATPRPPARKSRNPAWDRGSRGMCFKPLTASAPSTFSGSEIITTWSQMSRLASEIKCSHGASCLGWRSRRSHLPGEGVAQVHQRAVPSQALGTRRPGLMCPA